MEREKRMYIRNAILSFICIAVGIGIDVRNIILFGEKAWDWKLGVSIVLYVLLAFFGIRAVKKAKEYKKD